MVGNDIVDLGDADCRAAATHPRFDERVFTAGERRLIESSAAPEPMRWLLWAAKESAYKLLRKLDPSLAFVPCRLTVQPQSVVSDRSHPTKDGDLMQAGTVRHGSGCVRFRVVRNVDALHVIAQLPQGSGRALLAMVGETQSECPSVAVRRMAIEAIAAQSGVRAQELRIVREGGIPRLHWRGRRVPIDVSLSHHGRFVAFAATMDLRRGAA
jgi:phosphopantetheinyl transferase (holo-ACP synthase)